MRYSAFALLITAWLHVSPVAAQPPNAATNPNRPPNSLSHRAQQAWVAKQNPTYSAAVFQHRDPRELLSEREAQLNGTSPVHHALLAYAAKAALEAGENLKAREYATKALAAADAAAARYRNSPWGRTPRRFMGIPAADYCANFVLGRLALLDGNIRLAEQLLLASGKADGLGDAALTSYGPNLSLALEILRHGDQQSRTAVLQFLDEIKMFWKIDPAQYERWSADIVSGGNPDFMAWGPNLYN